MITARKMLGALAGAVLLVAGPAANAITLGYGDSNYLGYIDDNIPSSPSDEVNNINGLRQLAAGAALTDCPAPGATEDCSRVGSTLAGPFPVVVELNSGKLDGGFYAINLVGTFSYILGKYDGPAAGAWVWYSASGFTGPITLPSCYPTKNASGKDVCLGISHVSWYNGRGGGGFPLPEPGSLALLGLGLIGLGAARRKS